MTDTPHICKLPGCDEPVLRHKGEAPGKWRKRDYHDKECMKEANRLRGLATAPQDPPHYCQLDGCDAEVIRRPGERRRDWLKRDYCSDEHRRKAQRGAWRTEHRACRGCPKVFVPARPKQRYHDHACSTRARRKPPEMKAPRRRLVEPARPCGCGCGVEFNPPRKEQRYRSRECALAARRNSPRPTKQCTCGCGETFERPVGMRDVAWERRKFVNAEHQRKTPSPLATRGTGGAQPGAARAGNRKPPKPAPSRDRKPAPSRDRKPAPNKVASVAAFMPDRWSLRVGGVSAGACRGCEEPARNGRHVEDGTPVCPVRGTAS